MLRRVDRAILAHAGVVHQDVDLAKGSEGRCCHVRHGRFVADVGWQGQRPRVAGQRVNFISKCFQICCSARSKHTCAPVRASASAVALPMPLPAPVTTAALPASLAFPMPSSSRRILPAGV